MWLLLFLGLTLFALASVLPAPSAALAARIAAVVVFAVGFVLALPGVA